MITFFILLQILFDILMIFIICIGLFKLRNISNFQCNNPDYTGRDVILRKEVLDSINEFVNVAQKLLEAINEKGMTKVLNETGNGCDNKEFEEISKYEKAHVLLSHGIKSQEIQKKFNLYPGELKLIKNLNRKKPSISS